MSPKTCAEPEAFAHAQPSKEESKARAKIQDSSADIMRQKQEAAMKKKEEEAKKKVFEALVPMVSAQ